jgi:hypothetical protein
MSIKAAVTLRKRVVFVSAEAGHRNGNGTDPERPGAI